MGHFRPLFAWAKVWCLTSPCWCGVMPPSASDWAAVHTPSKVSSGYDERLVSCVHDPRGPMCYPRPGRRRDRAGNTFRVAAFPVLTRALYEYVSPSDGRSRISGQLIARGHIGGTSDQRRELKATGIGMRRRLCRDLRLADGRGRRRIQREIVPRSTHFRAIRKKVFRASGA